MNNQSVRVELDKNKKFEDQLKLQIKEIMGEASKRYANNWIQKMIWICFLELLPSHV